MERNAVYLLCCLCCAFTACSGDGERSLTIGIEPSPPGAGGTAAGSSGQPGASASGKGGDTPGAGAVGNDNALSVQVQDVEKLAIEIITLACAGDCADIEAVAHGGNPPYEFRWEDGSNDSKRHVCLDADAILTVRASDTAIGGDEFSYASHSASAVVTATVLDCSDAGTPPSGEFCIDNPSLEGTPGVAEIGGFQLPGWTMCYLTPNVEPYYSTVPASDGATYLGALDAIQDSLNESAGTAFCSPLQPARAVSFSVDISVAAVNPGAVQLELWGGTSACGKDELLWTSPIVSDTDTWHTFCGTLTPSKSYAYLVTWPVLASPEATASYLNVDNFRSQPSCD